MAQRSQSQCAPLVALFNLSVIFLNPCPVEIAAPKNVLYGVDGEVGVADLLGHGADRLHLVPGRPHLPVKRGRGVVPEREMGNFLIISS